jgi:hypothetical protein
MTPSRTIRLGAAAALAVLTLILSGMALAALNAGGEISLGPASLFPVAMGYDRDAEQILAPATPPPLAEQRRAVALSRSAIRQFPYDTSAWLRLAYVDALQHGGLSPQGVVLLDRSYDLVAVDPDVGLWRVRFALENSQRLPPDLRSAVRNEAFALSTSGKSRKDLKEMAPTIQNPAGRLSLALWLNRLSSVAK